MVHMNFLFSLLIIIYGSSVPQCFTSEEISWVQNKTHQEVRKPGSRNYPPLLFENTLDEPQMFGAWIAKIIVTELMGFNVTFVSLEDKIKSPIERLAEGDVHINFAVLEDGHIYKKDYEKYVFKTKKVLDFDDAGEESFTRGWYIPSYIVHQAEKSHLYPDFWRSYIDDPEIINYFIKFGKRVNISYYHNPPFIPEWCKPNPENRCVELISKTAGGPQSVIPQIIRNLKLNMTVVYVGSSFNFLIRKYLDMKIYFLFDILSPSREFISFEKQANGLRRIALPVGDYHCYENNTAGSTAGKLGFGSVDCDYHSALRKKFVSATLKTFIMNGGYGSDLDQERRNDYNDILTLVGGQSFGNWDIQRMLLNRSQKLPFFNVTCSWLKDHTLWLEWVNNSPPFVEESLHIPFIIIVYIGAVTLGTYSIILQITLFIHRKNPVIASSMHIFCQLIVFGSYFILAWAIMRDSPGAIMCNIRDVLGGIGFMFIIGAIFLKSYRTHLIFNSQSADVPETKQLLRWIVGFILFEIILKLVWHAMDPLLLHRVATIQRKNGVVEMRTFHYVCKCKHDDFRNFAYFTPKAILLILLVYVAFRIQNIRYNLKESSRTAFASYSLFLLSTVGFALSKIESTVDDDWLYLITTMIALLATFISTTLLLSSLLWYAYLNADKAKMGFDYDEDTYNEDSDEGRFYGSIQSPSEITNSEISTGSEWTVSRGQG